MWIIQSAFGVNNRPARIVRCEYSVLIALNP
nr:MAG TPA: hypothetical protein [Caudoviricetes sp.]